MQEETSEIMVMGLTLVDFIAVVTGPIGVLLGAVALILNWKRLSYTKSKDKIKLVGEIQFRSWHRQTNFEETREGGPFEGQMEREVHGFHIVLGNQGVDIKIQRSVLYTRPWYLVPRKLHSRLHGYTHSDDLVHGDSFAIQGELEPSDHFGCFPKLHVETRSRRTTSLKLKGFKKARKAFKKWANESQ